MVKKIVFGVLTLSLIACQNSEIELEDTNKYHLISLHGPAGEHLQMNVELADTHEKRKQGLMHREYLDPNSGMLFTFTKSFPLSFWMKDTLIPLDIIFFDAEMKFESTESMFPCKVAVCPYTRSDGPAQYALEVNYGFVEQYGISEEWRLEM